MTRFVILSVARSGTNLLRLLLDQHPRVRCLGEVLSSDYQFEDFLPAAESLTTFDQTALRRARDANPAAFFESHVWTAGRSEGGRAKAPVEAVGCKIFLPHLRQDWCREMTTYLAGLENLKVILLWRRDRLKRYLSMQQALTSGQWMETGSAKVPPPPVYLDRQRFRRYVDSTERMLDDFIAAHPDLPRFDLAYETLAADWAGSMERLFAFLDLPPAAVKPRTRAQGRASLSSALLNYRDLIDDPPALQLSPHFPATPTERVPLPAPPSDPPPAAPQRRWRLFCQVCADDRDILPHFLAHYRRLGVTDIHLVLHGTRADRRALLAACAGHPVTVEEEYEAVFQEQDKCRRLTRAVQRYPGEWVLLADADEFLELPYGSLQRTVRALQVLRLRSLSAIMLQRLAEDGALAPLPDPETASVEALYPLGSVLLNERLDPARQPWRSKYPLFQVGPQTAVQAGHHLAPEADASHAVPLQAVVHHYKWRRSFLGSLARRSQLAHANAPEIRGYGEALRRCEQRLPLEGSFRPTRAALEARGLLRRPDRRELALHARLGALRRRRQAEPADAPSVPTDERLLARLAPCWQRLAAPFLGSDDKPEVAAEALLGRRLNIGFVAFQLPFSERSAGAGTAVAASAEALAMAGHAVTILYAPYSGEDLYEGFRALWSARGIEVVSFPFAQALAAGQDMPPRLTHEALLWLDAQGFDLLHFHDCLGLGAPAVAAKRGAALFARTRLVVTAHGPTPWHRSANHLPFHANMPRTDHLERLQVALADHLVSPSRFLLGWLAADGYRLPASSFAHPNLLSGTARLRPLSEVPAPRPVREIVFFGRVEPRKGLAHFLDAIDRLAAQGVHPERVTFLGQPDAESEAPALLERRHAWPFESRLLESFDSVSALRYVTDGPVLVVVPSLRDNLPYTVLECIANGVPLLSTEVGGIPEMIAPEDRARVLAAGTADSLADALAAALRQGFAPARPAFEPDGALLWWLAWHGALGREADAVPAFHAARSGLWLEPERRRAVDLCVLPDDPAWNHGCLVRVEHQVGLWVHLHLPDEMVRGTPYDRPDWPQPGKLTTLRSVTRHEGLAGLSPGAIGNRLAEAGTADYLAFIDGSVELDHRALRVLADALAASSAAAAISGYEAYGHPRGTRQETMRPLAELQPMAGPLAYGAYENLYGGPCVMVRRDRFAAVGGLDEDGGLGIFCLADLLNRLQLAGDEVLPIGLLLYRHLLAHRAPKSLLPEGRARQLLLAPFVKELPAPGTAAQQLATTAVQLLGGIDWHRQPELALIEAGFAGMLPSGDLRDLAGLSRRLLSLQGRKLGQLVAAGHARIEKHPDGIEVHSAGDDPILLLKRAKLPPQPCQYLLTLEVETAQSAVMQLFWSTTKGGRYSEAQSLRRLVPSGRQSVTFVTPTIEAVGWFRLDPTNRMGSLLIRSLELYAVPV